MATDSIGLMLLGFFAVMGVGVVLGPQVAAVKIDKDFVAMRGAGRDFLESLPEWDEPV